jgi:hypothetical protein
VGMGAREATAATAAMEALAAATAEEEASDAAAARAIMEASAVCSHAIAGADGTVPTVAPAPMAAMVQTVATAPTAVAAAMVERMRVATQSIKDLLPHHLLKQRMAVSKQCASGLRQSTSEQGQATTSPALVLPSLKTFETRIGVARSPVTPKPG